MPNTEWRETTRRLYADYFETLRTPGAEMSMESATEFWHMTSQIPDDDIRMLLYVSDHLARELARGKRCGVCGNTIAQSQALNYDCAREC